MGRSKNVTCCRTRRIRGREKIRRNACWYADGETSSRKSKKNYRSETFSTTRTLSPRTVIGMGTTLS